MSAADLAATVDAIKWAPDDDRAVKLAAKSLRIPLSDPRRGILQALWDAGYSEGRGGA